MMERLLSVKDIMSRYQCTRDTAVKHIRQMEHLEHPYMVTESALLAYESRKTVKPPEVIRAEMMERLVR